MNFKYQWKNGTPPNRDSALRADRLLEEGQFNSESDRQFAEEEARKYLGLPARTLDADRSILPHAGRPFEEEEEL